MGLTNVTAIAAGVGHTCAIVAGGALKCWGADSKGQLGDKSSGSYAITPVDVYGLSSGVVSVAGGAEFTCAAMSDGSVKCWGEGGHGENTAGQMETAPYTVLGVSGAIEVTAGWNHACALSLGGAVTCWGWNWAGQIGNGSIDASNGTFPTVVQYLPGAAELSAGLGHTCALTNDGAAWCWGWNGWGQLGNGNAGNMGGNPTLAQPYPGPVNGLPSYSKGLMSGSRHNCAFGPSGQLYCWGENMEGQVGTGNTTTATAATAITAF
jgi:hypothetical protein